MKLIFRFILFSMLFTMNNTGFAQKETFGVVSYKLSKFWLAVAVEGMGLAIMANAYPPFFLSVELKYFSGTKETALILKNSERTERDGASNNNNDANEWAYSPRDKSIIDNPPGSEFDAGSAKSVKLPAEIK